MPKLLIVDDEVDILEFAKSFFKRRGVDVVVASDGTQALRVIVDEKPDLVLLDINMREMSGIEVLKNLKALNNPVKVIMVTGVGDESTMNQAKALGAVSYIHKPLILEELEKIVLKEISPSSQTA